MPVKCDIVKLQQEVGIIDYELKRGNYYIEKFTTDDSLRRIITFCNNSGIKLSVIIAEIEVVIKHLSSLEESLDRALAGPKLTVKILHFLPFIAILLSLLLGANPLKTYIEPIGIICLGVGGGFWYMGRKIINKNINNFEKLRISSLLDCPLIILCIFKSAVLSGLNIQIVLDEFYPTQSIKLKNGTPFRLAGYDDYLDCLQEIYYNGGSPEPILSAQISLIYRNLRHELKTKGEELAIMLTVPLAACFLPSFIFFGVIPTIVSLAR